MSTVTDDEIRSWVANDRVAKPRNPHDWPDPNVLEVLRPLVAGTPPAVVATQTGWGLTTIEAVRSFWLRDWKGSCGCWRTYRPLTRQIATRRCLEHGLTWTVARIDPVAP